MTFPSNPTEISLSNLSKLQTQLDSLSHLLSNSVNSNTILPHDQINSISSQLTHVINNVIINATSLISSQTQPEPDTNNRGIEIVEVDAVELLAENIHVCDFCGKGFKRDANLRMHMRAHGNQFKTRESLAKPASDKSYYETVLQKRFSCPYVGCNRNKESAGFKPMKSVVCVKNHFKRCHCGPKKTQIIPCTRVHLADHVKVCGEDKCRCSCGTSFINKGELFAHLALFEGHMPAMAVEEEEVVTGVGSGEGPSNSGGGGGTGLEFDELLKGFIGCDYTLDDFLDFDLP